MKINVTNGKQPINLLVEAGTYEKKYKTAEGNPVILTDAWSNYPLKSLGVNITPIQDLHGYDHPWVGGAGKNLFSVEMEHTASTYSYTYLIKGLTPNTQYTLSTDIPFTAPASLYFNGGSSESDGTYVNHPKTRTANENGELTIYVRHNPASEGGMNAYQAYLDGTNWVQLELGSTATSYEPYENLCPISGWSSVDANVTGVNVWDEEWKIGAFNTRGEFVTGYNFICSKSPIRVFPNTAYTTNTNILIWEYDADMNIIRDSVQTSSGTIFTTSNNAQYINFRTSQQLTTYNNDISINYPSTDHEYHAYTGQTITKDLGRTVYGCKVDIVSGQMVIDRAIVDLGICTWYYVSAQDCFYTYTVRDNTKSAPSFICSAYPYVGIYADLVDKSCAYIYGNAICVRDSSYNQDTTAFKTAMNGVQLVYELKDPQTIQLTPEEVKTLMKETILMTNADSLLVEYRTNER